MSGDMVFLQTNDEFCQWAGGKVLIPSSVSVFFYGFVFC